MNKWRIMSETTKKYAKDFIDKTAEDGSMEVVVRKHKCEKSVNQRAGFHFLLKIISDETGYTVEEVKELVKQRCFGSEEKKIFGEVIFLPKSSETLNRKEYSELIEGVYRLGAEAGILLPNLE